MGHRLFKVIRYQGQTDEVICGGHFKPKKWASVIGERHAEVDERRGWKDRGVQAGISVILHIILANIMTNVLSLLWLLCTH